MNLLWRPHTPSFAKLSKSHSQDVELANGGNIKIKDYYIFSQQSTALQTKTGSFYTMRNKDWHLTRPITDAAKCLYNVARAFLFGAECVAAGAATGTVTAGSVALGGVALAGMGMYEAGKFAGGKVYDGGALIGRGAKAAGNKISDFVSWAHTARKRLNLEVRESRAEAEKYKEINIDISHPSTRPLEVGSTGVVTLKGKTRKAQQEAVQLKKDLEVEIKKLYLKSKEIHTKTPSFDKYEERTVQLNKLKDDIISQLKKGTEHVKDAQSVEALRAKLMNQLQDIKWRDD